MRPSIALSRTSIRTIRCVPVGTGIRKAFISTPTKSPAVMAAISSGANPMGPIVEPREVPRPSRDIKLVGKHVTIVPTTADHASDIFAATNGSENAPLFDYMFDGPFETEDELKAVLAKRATSTDPVFYTILSNNGSTPKAIGLASLMNINVANRVVEVGNILYSPVLQRTRAATEAMLLMATYVIEDLGYRRYEWKCHSLNGPSRRAAIRLGFTYEGLFRQHMITRGRNRDTAWFSIIDGEWVDRKRALEQWLEDANFDAAGRQKVKLEDFRAQSLIKE